MNEDFINEIESSADQLQRMAQRVLNLCHIARQKKLPPETDPAAARKGRDKKLLNAKIKRLKRLNPVG